MADAADAEGDPYAIGIVDWMMAGIDGIETCRRLHAGGHRPKLRCVIVTAHDDAQMWAAARAAGIRSVLVKPVSLSTLHDALNEELGGVQAPDRSVPPTTGVELGTLQSTRAGAHVLLAEDNLVNQEVATELLRSAGLKVDVADSGTAAIARVRSEAYDLILMDVQMPEIDGLQATRAIRLLANGRTVPIVAMTANAFGEDREACLAAGMNDHVPKPVDPDALYATLLRWLPVRPQPSATTPAEPGPADAAAPSRILALPAGLAAIPGLDTVRGLQLFDGHIDMYLRVLQRFVATYRDGMAQIDQAIATGSWSELAGAAHSLRGAGGAVGATELEAAAARLEALETEGAVDAAAMRQAVALQAALVDIARRLRAALDPATPALPGDG